MGITKTHSEYKMEKFTPDILKRLELRHMKLDGNMYCNNVLGLIKYALPEKFTPERFINVQLKSHAVDIQKATFVYRNQSVSGLYIMESTRIINGKYGEGTIVKLGVIDKLQPMVCIVQTDGFDYEFLIAPLELQSSYDYEIFDIEKNETNAKNYKQETFEI